jgi:hypothetical protein
MIALMAGEMIREKGASPQVAMRRKGKGNRASLERLAHDTSERT